MSTGLDPRQLLEIAIRPALRALGPRWSTVSAEQLVLGTAAQESGLVYLRQLGNGPALGLWQMEPATFRWLRDGFLDGDAPTTAELRRGVNQLTTRIRPEGDEVAWNLRVGAAFCRLRYAADRHPLPERDDIAGHAATWKRVYNTALGAGKVDDYLRNWQRLVAPLRLWEGIA